MTGPSSLAAAVFAAAVLLAPAAASAQSPNLDNCKNSGAPPDGDLDRAITDYSEAIRINPRYAIAYFSRGNSYRDKGDLDRAITDYSEAIRTNPQYALAYNNRGLVKRAKGDSAGGDADIALAKQLSPSLGN